MIAPPTRQEQSEALRKELMQELMGTPAPKEKRPYNKSPNAIHCGRSKKAKFLKNPNCKDDHKDPVNKMVPMPWPKGGKKKCQN